MAQISIAVPVYNGEAMLGDALECLRIQSFTDFEVVILFLQNRRGNVAVGFAFSHRFIGGQLGIRVKIAVLDGRPLKSCLIQFGHETSIDLELPGSVAGFVR